MTKTFWTLCLALLAAMALNACGGGEKASDTAADDGAEMAQDQAAVAEDGAMADEGMAEDGETPPVNTAELYVTSHDPDAVYTYADLPMRGSYLKVDFEDMTDDQINRVVHRLRTEFCTCGCPSDPIDQCLVNDPNCTVAVTLAKQVIREEKIKG